MNGGMAIPLTFPGVLRKKTINNLFRHYYEKYNQETCIGLTLFRRIASTITDSDQEQRQSVDYVSGILYHDSTELLYKIIRTIRNLEMKQLCERIILRIQQFVSIFYSIHRGNCSYTTEYSLKCNTYFS
jgi:hypothetical protein